MGCRAREAASLNRGARSACSPSLFLQPCFRDPFATNSINSWPFYNMAAKDKKTPSEPQEDEDYDSNEDEDFNPDLAPAADEDVSATSDSDSDGDGTTATAKKSKSKSTKRKAPAPADEELDSGDEATIKERKRKRRKGKDHDEDSGGEGGLIKTRAQRLVEKAERKERKRADRGEVTVDVEGLWARLHAVPVGRHDTPPPAEGEQPGTKDGATGELVQPSDQLIRIKRRIAFAGEITEVEEEVLKSSPAAQAYLAEHPEADPENAKSRSAASGQQGTTSDSELQRPLKRPSIFEPNPTAIVRGVSSDKLRPRAPGRLDVLMAERRAAEEMKKKAERMSTVQKSAVDWKGFVADQGIAEELDVYGKSKGGFMAREQFLDRVAGANEEARRAARLKG